MAGKDKKRRKKRRQAPSVFSFSSVNLPPTQRTHGRQAATHHFFQDQFAFRAALNPAESQLLGEPQELGLASLQSASTGKETPLAEKGVALAGGGIHLLSSKFPLNTDAN